MVFQILLSERHEDIQWLHDNLYSYNLTKTGEARQVIILKHDPERKIFLAVAPDGERLGGCSWHVRKKDQFLFIDFLWMSEAARGSGCGSALIHSVENKAQELGCRGVELTTSMFQAPGFYRKMGYQAIHEAKSPTKNCPDNIHYVFRKTF